MAKNFSDTVDADTDLSEDQRTALHDLSYSIYLAKGALIENHVRDFSSESVVELAKTIFPIVADRSEGV